MISLFLTLRRLAQALKVAWEDTEFRNVLLLLVILMGTGTAFYAIYEGWSIVDSFYFSVVTLATVGYGDLAPKTTLGKLFTVAYLFVGIGIFVAVASHLARDVVTARKRRRKKNGNSAEADEEKTDSE